MQTISNDIIARQKAGDQKTLAALRLLRNALNTKAKEAMIVELPDEDAMKVLQSEAKKRRDSIVAYQQGNRPDLALNEQYELDLIAAYLPPALGAEQLKEIINQVVRQQSLVPPYDFGRLMGAVMKEVGARADGQTVRQAVQEFIQT